MTPMLPMMVAATQAAACADLPRPTFRWSFDDGMRPEICADGAEAEVRGRVRFVPGRKGRALFVPGGATIAFPTAGHVNPREGTVALWVKRTPPDGRPKYARLFDLTGETDPATCLRIIYPTHTILYAALTTGGQKYIPWPMGDASVRNDEWQHLAVTWAPSGATFYVNGVTLTATAQMPPLAALPERFYVGSEAAGEYSACAPIDEVYIFDRALRSHELFALAGRASPTDLTAANWLANSSFELGRPPWQTFLWAAKDSEARLTDEVAHSGRHSFVMDRSAETHDWWSTVWLIGPWLHLQREETVTLSAWMRADRPDVQVRLDIQRGREGRAVQGVPKEGELERYFTVGTEWQRVALTGRLPISYKDGYRPRISLLTKPCRLWVDDVQMALGQMRPYEPRTPVELGLSSAEDTATYDVGEKGLVILHVFNGGRGERRTVVAVTVGGPDGTVLQSKRVRMRADEGRGAEYRLEPISLAKPGHYVVTAEAGGQRVALTLAALRDHSDEPSPRSSPFGAHGGGDAAARRVGLSQYRDVSGLTWRWIERKRGEWRYDDRKAAFERRVAAGFSCCATLADAPGWAARPGGDLVPRDMQEWRRYVSTVIGDFAAYVDVWEVWNEPDLKPLFDEEPETYFEILKATRELQRRLDPDSRLAGLCAAGVTDRAVEWMERVMRLGALEQVDLLAWHPYYHERPEDGYFAALRRVNQVMEEHGGRRPMVFTEFGTGGVSDWALHIPWTADGWRKYDEREQAEMLVRQCVIGLGEGAVKLYWYKWREERIQTGPDTFGLLRADTYATPKMAAIAYNSLIWRLEAASLPPRRLAMEEDGQWGYEFWTPEGTVKVMWDVEGRSSVAWPADCRAFDLWGNELPHADRLVLTSAPRYLVEP